MALKTSACRGRNCWQRVDWALDLVEMQQYRTRGPHQLSGGQKQRICIAGVLAMQPDVLVLDEATAMLDPIGRKEVLEVARRLNRERGVTVIAVTHFMREALEADRMVVMAEGRIALRRPAACAFSAGRTACANCTWTCPTPAPSAPPSTT